MAPDRLVKKYVRDNAELGNRTIARMLRQDHPEHFHSIENARDRVRRLRGNKGDSSRKKQTEFTRPNAAPGSFQVPKGLRQGVKPFLLPLPAKVLTIADLHVPYHDEKAIEAALREGVDEGCDTLYINGDGIDFYKLSRWTKDPRARSAKQECDTLESILAIFAKYFERRFYKAGNHEDRYDHYLFQRADDLVEFEELELRKILRLEKHGFEFVRSKQRARFGKLNVLHGHELPRGIGSPVNPARGLWLRVKDTAICSHHHKSSQHTESHPLKKTQSATWSTGCLCDLSPEYASVNEWNHGFAIVDVGEGGRYRLSNKLIAGGEVYDV